MFHLAGLSTTKGRALLHPLLCPLTHHKLPPSINPLVSRSGSIQETSAMNRFNTNTSDTLSVASGTEASDVQPELLTPPAALAPLPSEVNRPQSRPEGAFKMWLVEHGYMISEEVDFENVRSYYVSFVFMNTIHDVLKLTTFLIIFPRNSHSAPFTLSNSDNIRSPHPTFGITPLEPVYLMLTDIAPVLRDSSIRPLHHDAQT